MNARKFTVIVGGSGAKMILNCNVAMCLWANSIKSTICKKWIR